MSFKKTVLITDLDNTLFDWVELWYNCFSPMLSKIADISGVSREELIPEIAAVHQKHGTSEYSFLLEELPAIKPFLDGRAAREVFGDAISIYRDQRRKYLKLFPTVGETLLKIRGRGTRIIAYTESMAFYSNYRIRRLGLDGILDYVFCPKDHVLPRNMPRKTTRYYPAEHYKLRYSKQRFTPEGSKKPDARVLRSIMKEIGLNKHDCVYLGDSLMKDVSMAIECGVDDVWAKYGIAHKRPEYKLLQDVTHWTAADVRREQTIKERAHVNPTHVLEKSFAEILDLFDFGDFHGNRGRKTQRTSR